MADETHLAVLRQGVDAWNAWRAAQADTRPELSNVSLRGLELAGADLAGADLRMTDMRGTILTGAMLTRADCANANFFKAALDGADLSGANLVGVRFLSCAQLMTTRNWQSAFRDPDLACGAPVPPIASPARPAS